MFGTAIDTTIGLVLTFLLFSILLTIVMEILSGWLKLRAKGLEDAIARLIENPSAPTSGLAALTKIFGAHAKSAKTGPAPAPPSNAPGPFTLSYESVYTHPLVAGDVGGKPSYVPGANFASALTQILGVIGGGASIGNVEAAVAKLSNPQLQTALRSLLGEAGGDLAAFRGGVERWFDNAMDRLSGGYKRFTQVVTFVIGLALAAGLNVDAVYVGQTLYADPGVRAAMVAAADRQVQAGAPNVPASAQAKDAIEAAQSLAGVAPVGWAGARFPATPGAFWKSLDPFVGLGWLLTALAGLMGAPFWFDALSGLVNLRNAGPKPSSSASGA